METSKNITEKLAQLKAEYPRYTTPQFIELATEKFLQDPEYKNTLSTVQKSILSIPQMLMNIFAYIGNNKTLLELRKSNKLFRTIVDGNPITLEQLRSYIIENRRKLSELQKSYLNSTRIQTKIKNGDLTLVDIMKAIQTIEAFEKVTRTIQDRQLMLSFISFGCLPAEIHNFRYSEIHLMAMRDGIPFEIIQGLTNHQVRALSKIAQKVIEIPQEVIAISQAVIEIPQEVIEIRQEDGTIRKRTTLTKIEILTLFRKKVEGHPLTDTHVEALKKGLLFEVIVKLNSTQVFGLMAGFSETDVKAPNFCDLHVLAVNSGIEKDEILGLNSIQLQAYLYRGVPRESLLNNSVRISHAHLSLLDAGYKWESIKDLTAPQASLLLEGKYALEDIKELDCCYGYTRELLERYLISDIKGLSEIQQMNLASNPDLSLKQIKSPEFSENAAIAAQHLKIPYEQLIKDFSRAQLAALNSRQGRLLSMEDIKKLPTPLHCVVLLLDSIPYKDIINLNAEDLLKKLQEKIDTSSLYPLSEAKREIEPQSPTLMISSQGKKVIHSTTQNNATQKELEAALEAFQKQEKEQFTQRKPKQK